MLGIISERARIPTFIDYAIVFDKICRKKLLELIGNLGIVGKGIRITQNLYWQQNTCIRIENELKKIYKK